jgi:hypothetical protein
MRYGTGLGCSENTVWVKVSATQFALYLAWENLACSLGAGALNGLQSYLEYSQMFFVIGAAFLLAVVLLLKVNLQTHQQKVRALEIKSAALV